MPVIKFPSRKLNKKKMIEEEIERLMKDTYNFR